VLVSGAPVENTYLYKILVTESNFFAEGDWDRRNMPYIQRVVKKNLQRTRCAGPLPGPIEPTSSVERLSGGHLAAERPLDQGLSLVEQNVHRAMDLVARAYAIENGRTVLEGTHSSQLGDADFTSKLLGLE